MRGEELDRRVPASTVTGGEVEFLALLPKEKQRQLLERSTRAEYLAGTIAYRPDDPPIAGIVERGLIRAYRSLPDGRQATVAFGHANEMVGGAMIVGRPLSVFAQIVVDSTLTILDLDTVRSLAARDPEIMSKIAVHLALLLGRAVRLICVRSLGDIRERLAYDLLERACRCQLNDGRLEAPATHADLADSIGSSREVVSRALVGLRAEGIVETAPRMVRVVNPVGLADIVRAFAI